MAYEIKQEKNKWVVYDTLTEEIKGVHGARWQAARQRELLEGRGWPPRNIPYSEILLSDLGQLG